MINPSGGRRAPDVMECIRLPLASRLGFFTLICLGVVIRCVSLAQVAY
jgi:hypothetical protein